jgi:hypothetical protein
LDRRFQGGGERSSPLVELSVRELGRLVLAVEQEDEGWLLPFVAARPQPRDHRLVGQFRGCDKSQLRFGAMHRKLQTLEGDVFGVPRTSPAPRSRSESLA